MLNEEEKRAINEIAAKNDLYKGDLIDISKEEAKIILNLIEKLQKENQELKQENKNLLYKGLYDWITEHKENLQEELCEGSCICGEWLGMGKLKYAIDEFDKKFYMFAKANVNPQIELYNFRYYHSLFIYPFKTQIIPNFIGVVPTAYKLGIVPDKNKLDELYAAYCKKTNRNVEGFVVNYNDRISKYVRMKNGKLTEHFDRESK